MARIGIVDDSVFIADKMKSYLESSSHEIVGIASDGAEGVELYQKYSPDLITIDLTMPNKNGFECLKEILVIDPNAKVLIVSSLNDQSMIVDCMNAGAQGYIEKPLKFRNVAFCTDFDECVNEALLKQ